MSLNVYFLTVTKCGANSSNILLIMATSQHKIYKHHISLKVLYQMHFNFIKKTTLSGEPTVKYSNKTLNGRHSLVFNEQRCHKHTLRHIYILL